MFKWIQVLYYKIKSKLNKDITILAVDIASKSTITFKNGSVIESLPINNSDIIRGHRSDLPMFHTDYDRLLMSLDKKELDKILRKKHVQCFRRK
jgi:hypothetical protein